MTACGTLSFVAMLFTLFVILKPFHEVKLEVLSGLDDFPLSENDQKLGIEVEMDVPDTILLIAVSGLTSLALLILSYVYLYVWEAAIILRSEMKMKVRSCSCFSENRRFPGVPESGRCS